LALLENLEMEMFHKCQKEINKGKKESLKNNFQEQLQYSTTDI
jgi:hypothetical protein